jgi:hypothetical protein
MLSFLEAQQPLVHWSFCRGQLLQVTIKSGKKSGAVFGQALMPLRSRTMQGKSTPPASLAVYALLSIHNDSELEIQWLVFDKKVNLRISFRKPPLNFDIACQRRTWVFRAKIFCDFVFVSLPINLLTYYVP